MATTTKTIDKCDYLVVGSGAASLAFVDTMLAERPSARIIMIDRKSAPGGHWVDAYGFVRLHQPSLLYGISSRQLEGNWLKLLLWNWILPWHHRASKDEILSYFKTFVDSKVASGQLRYYPNCEYLFDNASSERGGFHSFSSVDKEEKYSVRVDVKLVNGILGECKVPSQCPVEFPVDEGIAVVSPNALYESFRPSRNPFARARRDGKRYVVLGAGKTAMDTIVYLQRTMNVGAESITWVISNDVWMLAREGGGNPWSWGLALLESGGDKEKASLALEEQGLFVRLDKDVVPSTFRFPMIGRDELALMRRIPKGNIVRRGRVTSLRLRSGREVVLGFGDGRGEVAIASEGAVFVHCTSPGPFNGNENADIFVSGATMNLNLLYAPPVSMSLSSLAFLEAARARGTLNSGLAIELWRALGGGADAGRGEAPVPGEDVEGALGPLFRALAETSGSELSGQFRPIVNLALFLCLADEDVSVGHDWMKRNRLAFQAIPGFKSRIYENVGAILGEGKTLGFSDSELSMMALLRDRLKPLEGQ